MKMPPIAHAGGSFHGMDYTDSIEALNVSFEKGFKSFEIDLIELADSNIVCLHDLDRLGLDERSTITDFSKAAAKLSFTPCDINTLGAWIRSHPGISVITDTKMASQIDVLRRLADIAGTAQIIPQIYDPGEYEAVKAL